MSNRTLLIVALVLGILAALLVYNYISQRERELSPGERVEVAEATADIAEGTRLASNMVARREIPEAFVDPEALRWDDIKYTYGTPAARDIKKGAILSYADFGKGIGPTGLAQVVKVGERAITIAVDQVSAVAGLLRPNDHVDILGTFRRPADGYEATVTLLQNVTILAAGSLVGGVQGEGRAERATYYSTVTLRVTPEEAELITFASGKGKLVLTLRNPEDNDTIADLEEVNFDKIFQRTTRAAVQQRRDRFIERQRQVEILSGKRR